MRKNLVYLFTAFYALFSFTSCVNEEDNPDQVSDYDTVVTHENDDYDASFESAVTFTVSSTVAHPGEDQDTNLDLSNLSSTDQVIINAAIENMERAGYVKSATEEGADLVVLPYSFDNTVVGSITSWPAYWGDYWGGYWGDYWGWYYPYYGYPMTTYYTYDQGTVILEIIDTRVEAVQEDGTEKMPVIWQGILNGTETNVADNQNRIQKGISQMFSQSPYISKN